MMIIWNVGYEPVQARFAGKNYFFQPNEKKKLENYPVKDLDGAIKEWLTETQIAAHLTAKWGKMGLVLITDSMSKDEIEERKKKGLWAYHRFLSEVLNNFITKNKEREGAKMAAEAPDETVVKFSKFKNRLDKELQEVSKEDMDAVKQALSGVEEVDAQARAIREDYELQKELH